MSEKDALPELERMLKPCKDEKYESEMRIASLQCLLQLVLDSTVSESTNCHSGLAVTILKDEQINWPKFLYDYLRVGDGLDPNDPIRPADRTGLSCLMRLAKIGLRYVFTFGTSVN